MRLVLEPLFDYGEKRHIEHGHKKQCQYKGQAIDRDGIQHTHS